MMPAGIKLDVLSAASLHARDVIVITGQKINPGGGGWIALKVALFVAHWPTKELSP
jgi:hypothetical protein